MAKDKITDYDSTAGNNIDVGGINTAEGWVPSVVNNAFREIMSHLADAAGAVSGWLTLQNTITAGTTQTQAGATAITGPLARVTVCANANDGVKLPTAAAEVVVTVINAGAQNLQVWPNTSDTIDGGSADAVDANVVPPNSSRTYIAVDATDWTTVGIGMGSAADTRTAIGVAIGSDVQAYDAGLADVAGLAVTDGNFIVGDGANWVAESGATALASLGALPLAGGTMTGNIAMASGGGIDFSATADGTTMSSELFDDYEEGTYIAAIDCATSGSYTMGNKVLAYTKIGRMVHVQGNISVTGESSPNGELRLSLPFSAVDLGGGAETARTMFTIISHGDAGIERCFLSVGAGDLTHARFVNMTDTGTQETIDHSRVDTSFQLNIFLIYLAAT